MGDVNFKSLSSASLLALHADIMEELRHRNILRSANNPTGDLAEYLFCRAFNWQQAPNSQSGFDAEDKQGVRFQIKGRRVHARNKSRQLSALRNLKDQPFDVLAGVIFDDDYRVKRAALIPYEYVEKHATYRQHTNSHLFHLRDTVWNDADVQDVTPRLQSVLLT